jgi:hypothetical protein
MRFFEFKESNLTEAPLGTTGLFKYAGTKKDRVPVFLQKIKDKTPFTVKTKSGVDEVIIDPSEYDRVENWIKNPTPNFKLKTIDDRIVPFGSIIKTKEFGGENTGQRERIEQGQIEGIAADLEEAKAGKPFIKLLVGDKVVNAAAVEKERGSVNGRAPKSDMTVLDENGDPVAWVSLKDNTFRWGGWQHLHKVPEIANWLARVEAVTGRVFESGQAYGLHISDDLKQQIIYGKDFGGERGFSNVDAVLIGWTNIKKQGKQFVLSSDTVYKNGDIPSGPHTPYLVMRFMNGRNDLGFKNVRAETNTVSEGRKVKWLDSDQDIKSNLVQQKQKQIQAPINNPENNKTNKVNNREIPNISKNDSEIDKEQL